MSAALSTDEAPRLIDLLLDEQQTLTAVDEFSELHAQGRLDTERFETLIPTESPGSNEQYAFAVDLDSCTGCKACVTACHNLNGLEIGETWRRVGVIEGGGATLAEAPMQQSVTGACHHCASPACLEGCPVQAYDKDSETGIVIHLDDQCIGCRYCQLMCPYDVPQFSERLGIVRKCDMCHGRLSAGEAPACVQGCPNEAISIEIVDTTQPTDTMLLPVLPGSMPSSSLTSPTTRYHSKRSTPIDLRTVDPPIAKPAEGHTPLAVMLVLTQAAIGAFCLDALFAFLMPSMYSDEARMATRGLATLIGLAGLAASMRHIGRPQWAFRVFLGLRTSWMSREILVFGALAGAMVAATITTAAGLTGSDSDLVRSLEWAAAPLTIITIVSGVTGLLCSMMIYVATGRPLWRIDRTAIRFVGTAVLLGSGIVAVGWSATAAFVPSAGTSSLPGWLPVIIGLSLLIKLTLERTLLLRGEPGAEEVALKRSRALLNGALARVARKREGLALGCGIGLAVFQTIAVAAGWDASVVMLLATVCLLGCVAGELLERSLFFRSEAMRSMPEAR